MYTLFLLWVFIFSCRIFWCKIRLFQNSLRHNFVDLRPYFKGVDDIWVNVWYVHSVRRRTTTIFVLEWFARVFYTLFTCLFTKLHLSFVLGLSFRLRFGLFFSCSTGVMYLSPFYSGLVVECRNRGSQRSSSSSYQNFTRRVCGSDRRAH